MLLRYPAKADAELNRNSAAKRSLPVPCGGRCQVRGASHHREIAVPVVADQHSAQVAWKISHCPNLPISKGSASASANASISTNPSKCLRVASSSKLTSYCCFHVSGLMCGRYTRSAASFDFVTPITGRQAPNARPFQRRTVRNAASREGSRDRSPLRLARQGSERPVPLVLCPGQSFVARCTMVWKHEFS